MKREKPKPAKNAKEANEARVVSPIKHEKLSRPISPAKRPKGRPSILSKMERTEVEHKVLEQIKQKKTQSKLQTEASARKEARTLLKRLSISSLETLQHSISLETFPHC